MQRFRASDGCHLYRTHVGRGPPSLPHARSTAINAANCEASAPLDLLVAHDTRREVATNACNPHVPATSTSTVARERPTRHGGLDRTRHRPHLQWVDGGRAGWMRMVTGVSWVGGMGDGSGGGEW